MRTYSGLAADALARLIIELHEDDECLCGAAHQVSDLCASLSDWMGVSVSSRLLGGAMRLTVPDARRWQGIVLERGVVRRPYMWQMPSWDQFRETGLRRWPPAMRQHLLDWEARQR